MKPIPWQKLLVLLAIAFALRLAAGGAWQSRLPGRFGMGDSESYWRLGAAIAEGMPYQYGTKDSSVFRTPGYPLLLAPIIRLAGEGPNAVMLARAEAALLGTLAVLGVWWLTRLLFDDRTAILAAGLAAFYPGAIALSALVLSEAPFCPLVLLQLALWILAWRAPSGGKRIALGFAAGLAAGAATLMRPSWLLFTPLAIVVGLLYSFYWRNGRVGRAQRAPPETSENSCGDTRYARTTLLGFSQQKPEAKKDCLSIRHAWISLGMTLGLVAAMAPWWVRNARVTGHFVPTTLQVGASLYDGLNPNATGASNLEAFVRRFTEEEKSAEIAENAKNVATGNDCHAKEPFEWRLDRRMRDAALAWSRANPGRVLQLAGVKFCRMWNLWPNEPRLSSLPVRLAVFFTYTPLLIFAIIGAWRTFAQGWPYVLCWLPAVYLTGLHVVFVSSLRYREPAMLALLALAAGEMVRRGARGEGLGARD